MFLLAAPIAGLEPTAQRHRGGKTRCFSRQGAPKPHRLPARARCSLRQTPTRLVAPLPPSTLGTRSVSRLSLAHRLGARSPGGAEGQKRRPAAHRPRPGPVPVPLGAWSFSGSPTASPPRPCASSAPTPAACGTDPQSTDPDTGRARIR
jgi:hypothetical protein